MNYWHAHIWVRDFCGLWFNGLNGTNPSSHYHVNTRTNTTRFDELIPSFYCNIYYHIQ